VPHTTCRRVLMIFMMRHAFVPDRDKRGGLAPGVRGGSTGWSRAGLRRQTGLMQAAKQDQATQRPGAPHLLPALPLLKRPGWPSRITGTDLT
jgi:hypothetical protein